ncbi:MAG: hypothetical protein OXE77_02220 [Flavobacteriaceae bacterium]|nr:hypothetical protein [Flavobacteriaceae bacterium]MCY4267623.1 hypothetical protein [Flavobacteriaceae bacterium]
MIKKCLLQCRFVELEASERASIFNALFENEEKENVIVGFKVKSDFKADPMIEHPKKMFQEVISRGNVTDSSRWVFIKFRFHL